MTGFLFLLLEQGIVEVFQNRHSFRERVFKECLVNLVNAAVNHRFFYRLQALLAAHNQLTQGENKIGFQGNGVVLLGVIAVDVHGVDILSGGGADFDDLAFQTCHQRCIFRFGVANDDIVTGGEEGVGNFTLCRKRLAGTGGAENQAIGVFQLFPVNHNQIVGKSVQTVIQCFLSILKQLLSGKGNKNGCTGGSHTPLNLNLVVGQGQRGHEALFLLIIQPTQIAVVLLGDGVCLEHIGFQLLLGIAGVQHQKGQKKHTLILRLELL